MAGRCRPRWRDLEVPHLLPAPDPEAGPPKWIAARAPDSHNFAVANGCNVVVTPLMKGDEEVVDLKNKFEAALANNPGVPRPQLMLLRPPHVHSADAPEDWKVGTAAISRFYRTFDAWFGNKQVPVNGILPPSPEEKFKDRPEFELENIRKNTMIGTPEEIIARIRHDQELGVDEFSFWADNSLSHAEKKRSLELFIQHVIPALR